MLRPYTGAETLTENLISELKEQSLNAFTILESKAHESKELAALLSEQEIDIIKNGRELVESASLVFRNQDLYCTFGGDISLAYVVSASNPIHLCPQFFRKTKDQKLETFIHEVVHTGGIRSEESAELIAYLAVMVSNRTPSFGPYYDGFPSLRRRLELAYYIITNSKAIPDIIDIQIAKEFSDALFNLSTPEISVDLPKLGGWCTIFHMYPSNYVVRTKITNFEIYFDESYRTSITSSQDSDFHIQCNTKIPLSFDDLNNLF